ncbi:hypothetical protein [Mangrovibacterium diazotrophicum]|uniref:Uncharacterized protein n=1 Tax=Mangrovibacterium diazotrophicum TaxID=1261403 RepID=A0A419VW71_9BACT|nr:hypothetical protein [Mangrovibacterium diazotrophicum]RKD86393.1 hypothetical protein BC643_4084 [Mangrovibacterium diazotrophicum]
MIVSSDKEYIESKLIRQGKSSIKKEFIQFANWMVLTYSISPLNVTYEIIEVTKRPRVMIILEREKEKNAFYRDMYFLDSEKEKTIVNWLKTNLGSKLDLDNLFIVIKDFESIAKDEANNLIPEYRIEELIKNLDINDLWKIFRLWYDTTFFFYTDKQIEEYSKKGIEKYLADCYFDLLKEYDEFDYIKREDFKIKLDSKENFDNNYQSNWFYYTR